MVGLGLGVVVRIWVIMPDDSAVDPLTRRFMRLRMRGWCLGDREAA